MATKRKPKLSVWKFASCDGCQLSLLDCEDELLAVAGAVEIAYFVEASRAMVEGPYDLTLIDGSITTPHDAELIQHIRRVSRYLVALGTCANSGGIQALRNFTDVNDYLRVVYDKPECIQTLKESTPVSAHVKVDYGLNGCPINKHQLLAVISALLQGRPPMVRSHSVCLDCKLRGNVCVMVMGNPCLGPVTHAGCGAVCPTYHRGCYGCYGPKETPNTGALAAWFSRRLGLSEADLVRAFRSFYANAPAFRQESEAHDH